MNKLVGRDKSLVIRVGFQKIRRRKSKNKDGKNIAV
jgi:hypothetical protein